jgi:crotonobetainyl-CoA:carnitine CoA-transferase CaiB-like acyl-CoA transferase
MNHQTDKKNLPGPLEGIKVVEYGVFHAGPGATAILGDLGADVIKIESAGGDPERYWRHIGQLDMSQPNGDSFWFEISNRNKRGLCLDIKTPSGREVLHRLVGEADVFLTNLRKSTKTRLGLDYATLSQINPRLIHANVSGYGPEGPMEDLGAFDPLGLARSGLMFVTGNGLPALMHIGVLDQATAIAASHAIITALFTRERQGHGQEVHVSLFSTGLWLSYPNLMLTSVLSLDPTASGGRSQHSPLRNVFCCADGKWIIGTHHPEDKYWKTFCEATGQEHILDDPRFADDESRKTNCVELVAIFDQVFAQKTRDEWMAIFLAQGLMFCSIQKYSEIASDPQALINNYMVPFEHSKLGSLMVPGYPVHFSANQAGMRKPSPDIGEDTDQVLKECGYSEDEIAALKKAGVVK